MVKLQLEYAPTPQPLKVVCGSVVDVSIRCDIIASCARAVHRSVPSVEIEKIEKVIKSLLRNRELTLRDCCYLVHPAHVYDAVAVYHSAVASVQSLENVYPGTLVSM